MISNYSFTSAPSEHSPQFFDDIGDVEDLIREKREITHYYKQYAWIQSDDSFLKIIGKIAFACMTLTASLWVTQLLDHWTEGQRNEAFQTKLRKFESEETEGKCSKFFNQTVVDLFRQVFKVDGKDLYQMGWERLQKDQITSDDPGVQQEVNRLRDIIEFSQIKDLDDERDEKLRQAKRVFYDAIEDCVKEDVLPELFQRLKEKHGLIRALQIHNGFNQTLTNKMGDYLFHTFFKALDEDFESLHFDCKWGDFEGISSGEMQIVGDRTLVLHRNYRLSVLHLGEEITKARVELKLTIDIESLVGHSDVSIHPFDSVTTEEARVMNDAWSVFGFNMPLPVVSSH